jgi:hypothetical protein
LGFNTGWRLAYISVTGVAGPFSFPVVDCSTATELACRDNELGYILYHNLASISGINKTGTHTVGDVTLTNIQALYWSGTDHTAPSLAWDLRFDNGLQFSVAKTFTLYGWAVRNGDVSAVPVPPALYLFGTGLLGLVGMARTRRHR